MAPCDIGGVQISLCALSPSLCPAFALRFLSCFCDSGIMGYQKTGSVGKHTERTCAGSYLLMPAVF